MITYFTFIYSILSVFSPKKLKVLNNFIDKYYFDKRFISNEQLTKFLQRIVIGISLLNFIILPKDDAIYLTINASTYLFALIFISPKKNYKDSIKSINSNFVYIYLGFFLGLILTWSYLLYRNNTTDLSSINFYILASILIIHISLVVFNYIAILISKYSTILFRKYLFYCADFHYKNINTKPLLVLFVTVGIVDVLCVKFMPYIFSFIL